MATASDDSNDDEDGVVRLWALPSGRPVGRPVTTRGRRRVAQPRRAHAGHHAVPIARRREGDVEIVDVATHRRRTALPETDTVTDLARFTPDGRFIVAGSWKGWARLWSTKTWRPASRTFIGHAGRVEWESISPDGRTLATGGPEGAIRLWDLPTQQPLGAPLPALPNHEAAPQFTPDGNYLFVITDAGRAYRWDMRTTSGRNMPAPSPAARSLGPSGRPHCPTATTRRPAPGKHTRTATYHATGPAVREVGITHRASTAKRSQLWRDTSFDDARISFWEAPNRTWSTRCLSTLISQAKTASGC